MYNYVDFIKRYEGCSLKAYLCPAHKWTIGYGNTTYSDGTAVKEGDIITKEQADGMLIKYISDNIMPHIKDLVLTENQQIALISLIYNIGWTAFSKSKCYKAIKEKDWCTAYQEWTWIKAAGKPLLGLVKRRAEEKYLFFCEI